MEWEILIDTKNCKFFQIISCTRTSTYSLVESANFTLFIVFYVTNVVLTFNICIKIYITCLYVIYESSD